MSTTVTEASSTVTVPAGEDAEGWELDVSIVESGPSADRLIQMTDDGCGSTCQSACSTTCP
ncbi:FxLD family lanthipeptide [Streptomyces sp. AM 4-1-1]|uniref:FxLD family lanthipeptide n=1 Tax=Streptomyces sp. AM 4-1-1 TaxID=3028710 RepID=UPI0023B895A5|nr:FxLD family lanthipeptide [Streptomyces sp. AM 4-1-1]WEH31955.1 FxLD family lanthipeptide [Streptomyces sp. AM 4-1-1]